VDVTDRALSVDDFLVELEAIRRAAAAAILGGRFGRPPLANVEAARRPELRLAARLESRATRPTGLRLPAPRPARLEFVVPCERGEALDRQARRIEVTPVRRRFRGQNI